MIRRRAAWILLPLAFLTVPAAAGDVFVPSSSLPGPSSCNSYPFNANYREFRYQLVIPAALLGQKPYEITAVSFGPCQNVTMVATRFEMTMSHSTLSTPSATYAQNLPNPRVVIPAGPLSWVRTKDTWSPLKLASPFIYNGVDNLTIEVRYQGGSLQGNTTSNDSQTNNTSLNYYRVYGHGTGAYANPTARSVDPKGALMVRLTYTDAHIVGSGSPSIGSAVTLALRAPTDGGLPYQIGTSLGTGPIPIGNRNLGLSLDVLLLVTVRGALPTVFQNFAGILDATGRGSAKIAIPNVSQLVGVRLHSAFLTLKSGAPFNVQSISTTFSFSITK
jgi:hypothetical protein